MTLVRPPPSSRDLVFDDGEPLETNRHRQQMNLLIDTLDSAWADRNDVFVGGNMFLYYSETQSRRVDFRGPDVFVVLGTTRKDRKGWVVWEEDGKLPDVIIELLSASRNAEAARADAEAARANAEAARAERLAADLEALRAELASRKG